MLIAESLYTSTEHMQKHIISLRDKKVQGQCPFHNTNVPFTTKCNTTSVSCKIIVADDANCLVFFPNQYFIDCMTFPV